MNIIAKHTLKNIFKNPFRSLVLILCVTVTCITAYLTLDMSTSIENIFVAYTADMLGTVDVELDSNRAIDKSIFDELPSATYLDLNATTNKIATRDPEQYSYEYVQPLTIFGLDIESACKMSVFKTEFELSDEEIAISSSYAEKFGYEVGDTVSVYDVDGEYTDYIVKIILDESGVFIKKNEYSAVVNESQIKKLLKKDEIKSYSLLADLDDDSEVNTFCDYLEDNYPDITVIRVRGNDDIKNATNQMVAIFSVLFVVTFLMVIFVTVSLSEKIVSERMAVIGTLRSLGISQKLTTFLLLIENVAYGLIGFALGTLFYGTIRPGILGSMFTTTEGSLPITPLQPWVNVVVLIGAIVVECFVPVIELSKAVKTAIRDIIFGNKDTDYRFSKKRTIGGAVLLGLAAVMVVLNNAGTLILSIILVVIGVALVMPVAFREISRLLATFFEKVNMPIAELAAKEMGTKKSTISNSILCLVVSALAIAIMATSNGLLAIADDVSYDADIIAVGASDDTDHFTYIEDLDGVEEVVYMRSNYEALYINGVKTEGAVDVNAFTDSDMFKGFPDLPESLANDECVVCTTMAKKLGLNVGDTIEVKFKEYYLFPVTKELKIVGLSDTSLYESTPVIIISEDLFVDMYHDVISGILIRLDSPEYMESVKEVIDKHSLDQSFIFYTMPEYKDELAADAAGVKMAVNVAIGFGVLLSVIGLSGNQVLGFEARRREYAVMYSTSMSRKQITRLIFQETLLSIGSSVLIGMIVGVILSLLIRRTTVALTMSLPVGIGVTQCLLITVILIFIMVITSLRPLRLLKKMKIAEELKYE